MTALFNVVVLTPSPVFLLLVILLLAINLKVALTLPLLVKTPLIPVLNGPVTLPLSFVYEDPLRMLLLLAVVLLLMNA
jgi:hypothetical protein